MSLFLEYPQLADPQFVEGYELEGCATATDPAGPIFEIDVAVAVLRCEGNFSSVAAVLKRSRRTIALYIDKNIGLTELVEDVRSAFLDEVEEAARKLARAQDGGMVKFLLSTIGKTRGYVTRVEATGKDGRDLNVMFWLPENGRDKPAESAVA